MPKPLFRTCRSIAFNNISTLYGLQNSCHPHLNILPLYALPLRQQSSKNGRRRRSSSDQEARRQRIIVRHDYAIDPVGIDARADVCRAIRQDSLRVQVWDVPDDVLD